MNTEHLQLMHEVLDGEASKDEARELERLLAIDPEARAEYEELRCFFESLNGMRKAVPPEGLLEIQAKLPRQYKRRHRLRQLSLGWRVLVSDSTRLRGKNLHRAARTQRTSQSEHNTRNALMSELSGKRKLWIGGGVAAVAMIVAARYFDFPPSHDMYGTIAPASRSVAPQPGAGDMAAGSQTDLQHATLNVTDDASRDAARDAVRDASHDAAMNAQRDFAHDAARDSARDAQRDFAHDAARDSARDAQRDFAHDAARDSARDAQRDFSHDAARDSARDAQRDASRDAAHDATPQP